MLACAMKLSAITKSFGQTRALVDLSLDVEAGSVHAILGENGAGKSTLIKILTGVLDPDEGHVEIFGERLVRGGLRKATQMGIATVFQELSLVPHLSVADNLFLSNPPRSRFGWIDLKRQKVDAKYWLDLVGLDGISPVTHVAELSLTQRQLLEIAKSLAKKPRILLLDEATASLPGADVDRLFDIIQQVRKQGLTTIYISHRMSEIERIADRCSVLRNGRHVETFDALSRSRDEVCRMLAGRDISQLFPPRRALSAFEPTVLRVMSLSVLDKVRDVSFELRRGEVLGLGGLDGQGQKELLMTLYGAIRRSAGTMEISGAPYNPGGPAEAMAGDLPVALLPEDRKTDGLLLHDAIEANILLSVRDKLSRFGLRDRAVEHAQATTMIERLAIKMSSMQAPVGELSGGNQQKVLLARLLLRKPAVYILMDPTRGIDVGTKQEIYALIRQLATEGAAVLYLTTDIEELIGMCDRVLIFYGGSIARELEGGEINEMNILDASLNMGGQNVVKQNPAKCA
jgi:ribose transport system ATP-binding protein